MQSNEPRAPAATRQTPAQQPAASRPGPGRPAQTAAPGTSLKTVLDSNPGSRAFVSRLFGWFSAAPAPASSVSLVEKLVLLFSRLAVLLSMAGLLYGAWISVERWEERQAARSARLPVQQAPVPARQPGSAENGSALPAAAASAD